MELSNNDKKYGWFPYWRCWLKDDSIFALDANLNNLWVLCLSKASHKKTKWDFIVKGKGKVYFDKDEQGNIWVRFEHGDAKISIHGAELLNIAQAVYQLMIQEKQQQRIVTPDKPKSGIIMP